MQMAEGLYVCAYVTQRVRAGVLGARAQSNVLVTALMAGFIIMPISKFYHEGLCWNIVDDNCQSSINFIQYILKKYPQSFILLVYVLPTYLLLHLYYRKVPTLCV